MPASPSTSRSQRSQGTRSLSGRLASAFTTWRLDRTYVIHALILIGISVIAYAAFIRDPEGLGGLLYLGVAAVHLSILTMAPLVRGLRPLRVWAFEVFGGLLLLGSLLVVPTGAMVGGLRLTDILTTSGTPAW